MRNASSLLSRRIQDVSESPTLAVASRAKELAAEGVDVVDFSVGEPDFPTPAHVCAAAKKAIDEGFTRYTQTTGIPALRAAIADQVKRLQGVTYDPSEILVAPGAKSILYAACVALFGEGDEVIVPAPYWVSYPAQLQLVGATPIIVQGRQENDFKITPDELMAACTDRTKGIILNNPSNPTGCAYDRDELLSLCRVIEERDLIVISDEIYDRIVYDGFRPVSPSALGDGMRSRTVLVNGLSKSHAMTGWRLGYACAPRPIIQAMTKLQSHDTSNACSITQKAAVAALTGPQTELDVMVDRFRTRRDLILSHLRELPGVTCNTPKGAFYVFPSFKGWIRKHQGVEQRPETSSDLASLLLEEAHVAVVPGEAFGAEGYLRFSYATSEARIVEGMERVRGVL